jgi:hypothetical protein
MLPTREFAGGHHRQQCTGIGTGVAPGLNLTGIVRDLPANSRSLLMIITQEPTQSLATLHRPVPTSFRDPTEQQDVGLPLMIPLGMVMLDVFVQRSPQGALTKKNDLR